MTVENEIAELVGEYEIDNPPQNERKPIPDRMTLIQNYYIQRQEGETSEQVEIPPVEYLLKTEEQVYVRHTRSAGTLSFGWFDKDNLPLFIEIKNRSEEVIKVICSDFVNELPPNLSVRLFPTEFSIYQIAISGNALYTIWAFPQ